MTGILAQSGELIELRELGGSWVNGKCGDRTLFAGFVGGIDEFSAGVNYDPGGVPRFGRNTSRRELAGLRVEFESVDALTVGFGRVGADKGEVGAICGGVLWRPREGAGHHGGK